APRRPGRAQGTLGDIPALRGGRRPAAGRLDRLRPPATGEGHCRPLRPRPGAGGGRDDPRLVPLLACLAELLPWLKQWHDEVDAGFGYRMGDYYEGFVQDEARQMGRTIEELRNWQPPARKTARKAARTQSKKEK